MNRVVSLVSFIVFVAHLQSRAQDLVSRIPGDAFAVVSVKTDHFFELVPAGDFDNSVLGSKLL